MLYASSPDPPSCLGRSKCPRGLAPVAAPSELIERAVLGSSSNAIGQAEPCSLEPTSISRVEISAAIVKLGLTSLSIAQGTALDLLIRLDDSRDKLGMSKSISLLYAFSGFAQ